MGENIEEIKYEDVENENLITFSYAGHSWTLCPDDNHIISADDDGSATLDPRIILEMDEEKKILYIEQ